MTPTMELRFVERITLINAASGGLKYGQKVRILQQMWATPSDMVQTSDVDCDCIPATYEWRDVPVEKETL
jgi:hypothetical protein